MSVSMKAQLFEPYKRKISDVFDIQAGVASGLTVKITDSIAGGMWMQTTANIPFGTTVRYAIKHGLLIPTGSNSLSVVNTFDNQLISGTVVWVSGFTFNVSACQYYIQRTLYNSNAGTITLSSSDSVHPRIDVIYVDTNGTIGKLTGYAEVDPAKPICDPLSQLELTSVYIPALSTQPSGISEENVYLENVEWTSSVVKSITGVSVNFLSTVSPHSGTYQTRVSKTINSYNGEMFQYTKPTGSYFAYGSTLIMSIRISKAFTTRSNVVVVLYDNATAVGSTVLIKAGAFGFNSSLLNTYQTIAIPFTSFLQSTSANVNIVRFFFTGTWASGAMNIDFDDIKFQGGVLVNPSPEVDPIFTASFSAGPLKDTLNTRMSNKVGISNSSDSASRWNRITHKLEQIKLSTGTNYWTQKTLYLTPTDSLNKGLSIKKFITVRDSAESLITSTLVGHQNHIAIFGIDSSTNVSSVAVGGRSVNGTGVYGSSKNSTGIFGGTTSTTPDIAGVFGVSTHVGTFGITGSSSDGIPLELDVHPSYNNMIFPIMELYNFTTGTAQNGIGGYLDFNIQNNGGSLADAGWFSCYLTNVHSGYESSSFEWATLQGGNTNYVMSIDSSGILKLNNDNPSATIADSALQRNKTTGNLEMRLLPYIVANDTTGYGKTVNIGMTIYRKIDNHIYTLRGVTTPPTWAKSDPW